MKKCDKCRCTGRVESVKESPGGRMARYICPNPRCGNYRQVFAEENLKNDELFQDEKKDLGRSAPTIAR